MVVLGGQVFWTCTFLSQIVLTSGLTVIGVQMFYMNGKATLLGSIAIPSTITFIGQEFDIVVIIVIFHIVWFMLFTITFLIIAVLITFLIFFSCCIVI